MTEIRETYAAWKSRILDDEPNAKIATDYRDGVAVDARAASEKSGVFSYWPPAVEPDAA